MPSKTQHTPSRLHPIFLTEEKCSPYTVVVMSAAQTISYVILTLAGMCLHGMNGDPAAILGEGEGMSVCVHFIDFP